MTAPTTPPASLDDLMPAAHNLAREVGQVPSPSKLQRVLRVGYPRAMEIHSRLVAESKGRRLAGRRAMRSVRARSGGRRPLPARFAPSVPVPLSPGMGPVPDRVFPQVGPGAKSPVPTVAGVTSAEPAGSSGRVVTWPAQLIALPAYVAIWAGWVALGKLTGFGRVDLLPGFFDGWVINTAITLPIGVEAYAAYAFYVALNRAASLRARRFAGWSALGALLLGMGGQTAYHLMSTAGVVSAPPVVTTVVSCLPVAVFGAAMYLVHLVRQGADERS